MSGKVCMITGANSGIGKATAMGLAKMGATVVMACRNQERGESAMEEIKKMSGNDSIRLFIGDLSSLESVRALARNFVTSYNKLHVIVNDAGVFRIRRSTTNDGLETTFQVNYLSHFLLTNLLLPLLTESAPSRIINISSDAHYGGHIEFNDLQGERNYSGARAYAQSKLAQVLFTHELSRRIEGERVTANALHPGVVATNIWKSAAGPLGFVTFVPKLFMITPEQGAETPIYLASSPDVEGVSGRFFYRKKERKSSVESYDKLVAGRLWEVSRSLSGFSGE
jgi:NAD(P)-dependent dehydrogenase (short-subunit alcohol dehydrogenase family)